MSRAYYSDLIATFQKKSSDEILGQLTRVSQFSDLQSQKQAWLYQIKLLKTILKTYDGAIYFEFDIPRMGRRIDVVLLLGPAIFVLEFKVGEQDFTAYGADQVWDYALDLKNFHDTSHERYIVPILIATDADNLAISATLTPQNDLLFNPVKTNAKQLGSAIESALALIDGDSVDQLEWENGRYCPTPTIIEAAMALYHDHTVEDISRKDASAVNLQQTTDAISEVIRSSKINSCKSICFITGVPGAGKTLVGLNIATKHIDKEDDLYSVFLSGNGPLVAILREALARDKVRREKEKGNRFKKTSALSEVKLFIQNVHHFRDACLNDNNPPIEHVALFDEAQRAWNVEQTSSFMKRKKNTSGFNQSEPEFLISCLDRHADWAVIVCLVGGGQEINTGEAGISEWIESLNRHFSEWRIHISSHLHDSEYGAGSVLQQISSRPNVTYNDYLHLSVSMRSFRAENVSLLIKQLLDQDIDAARTTLNSVRDKYPIVITRDLNSAKRWLKEKARGSERFGIVVSSQAERLKPHAIDVKTPMDPVHWFLDGKNDVRSSYYLEDVATEFHVQGLELDWACVAWDADFRYSQKGWEYKSFCGSRWNNINKEERKVYLKNAYRVLLTRARQGMVIVVPLGDCEDQTRSPEFYNPTFSYLREIGFSVLE
ncbi:MAG: DUF2075 domain-containing protein [Geobacteraceae bacterium]|nr:DUF2075 domain-containing protein [Geobacteraceae bacterium]